MTFEVEQKFPVTDVAAIEKQLGESGGESNPPIRQIDRYFAHPSRDFAQTDEALRIRQVGTRNFITYKGPKIDAMTKTRREIELALQEGQGEAESWEQLLQALGFSPVARVCKTRRKYKLTWQESEVAIALDDVDELGKFVELELVCEADSLDEARGRILSLADHLGLSGAERRSYLELLLDRERRGGASD
jgi:adenylate cyclase class 2